jgi:molecular chaperone IbpA
MRNTLDMAPFARSLIGFDRVLDQLETLAEPEPGDNYPPYNIEKVGDDRYRVALAVAGFSDNELNITVEANQMTVSGKKADSEDATVLYRGIAHRPFIRRFSLADFVVVKDAKLSNGLLTIDLERQLPETMKPRRIAINGHSPAVTDTKHAA